MGHPPESEVGNPLLPEITAFGANPDVEIPLFGEEVRDEVGDIVSSDDTDNVVLMQTEATINICNEHIQSVSSYYVNRLK
eukprot:5137903-Pyramimonas_sp.AAC.1